MKRIVRIVVVSVLLLAAIVAGGSLYMLSYSLRPDATMRAKNASSYEYMYGEYPFLRPWVDSLERTGALRDTVILGSEGERLHAIYAAAPRPTDRTAVIVHGYTDNAVRMLMIGYLYNHDLGCNILLPDLYYHGQSEGRAIRMGWKDRFDVLRWMEIANDINQNKFVCKCSVSRNENRNVFTLAMEFVTNSRANTEYQMSHALRLLPAWVKEFNDRVDE